METFVKLIYQKETGDLSISSSGRIFDVSSIKNLPIEQWVFPFYAKGVRWNGLYEELKTFVGSDTFILQVDSDNASFEILGYVLEYTQVKLERINKTDVTLVYSEDPFVTRILIDGKPFDTTKIQNRSIDEWMFPIDVRGVQWAGLFKELENYLNSNSYTIFFVGEQRDFNLLLNNCPESVSVFYRDPKVLRIRHNSESVDQKRMGSDFKTMSDNFSESAQKVKETVGAAVSGNNAIPNGAREKTIVEEEQSSDLRSFIQKNFVVVCAVILIILLIFPFMRFRGEAGSDLYIVESTVTRVLGFGMIFGTGVARINSAFAVALIIAPIWMVVITFFKPLMQYAKYLIFLAPIIGIVFGFLAYRDIRNYNDIAVESAYSGDIVSKTSPGIGFILTLVVYIIVFIWAIRQCLKQRDS